jgi:hypothetical protein
MTQDLLNPDVPEFKGSPTADQTQQTEIHAKDKPPSTFGRR